LIIGNPVSNPFVRNGKPLVSKTEATGNLKNDICKAVDLIGGFGKIMNHGDKVLIKPNYNSSDKPPASTDPVFLKAVVELLFDYGAGKVAVGKSSWQMPKTRKALDETGTLDLVRGTGADLAFFDEGSYTEVNIGGAR
jgi:uncharacterized protein (DUF362 family)